VSRLQVALDGMMGKLPWRAMQAADDIGQARSWRGDGACTVGRPGRAAGLPTAVRRLG
jgi:hypothetical protein